MTASWAEVRGTSGETRPAATSRSARPYPCGRLAISLLLVLWRHGNGINTLHQAAWGSEPQACTMPDSPLGHARTQQGARLLALRVVQRFTPCFSSDDRPVRRLSRPLRRQDTMDTFCTHTQIGRASCRERV